MFNLLFLLILTIAGLTFIAALNDGPNQFEIRQLLKSSYSSLGTAIDNVRKLVFVVFKDIIQAVTKKEISLGIKSNEEVTQKVEKYETSTENTLELSDFIPEEDVELKEFSSEVIDFIEQEENKVA